MLLGPLLKFEIVQRRCGELEHKNCRDAPHKPFVQRFVPAGPHGEIHARATAQRAQQKQRLFRDTPAVALRFPFVKRHSPGAGGIHCQQVNE